MADFDETFTCPDCQRRGAPVFAVAARPEHACGWHVTCPDCGVCISGREKAAVMAAVSVLAKTPRGSRTAGTRPPVAVETRLIDKNAHKRMPTNLMLPRVLQP